MTPHGRLVTNEGPEPPPDAIPYELLAQIFSHLQSPANLYACAHVCRRLTLTALTIIYYRHSFASRDAHAGFETDDAGAEEDGVANVGNVEVIAAANPTTPRSTFAHGTMVRRLTLAAEPLRLSRKAIRSASPAPAPAIRLEKSPSPDAVFHRQKRYPHRNPLPYLHWPRPLELCDLTDAALRPVVPTPNAPRLRTLNLDGCVRVADSARLRVSVSTQPCAESACPGARLGRGATSRTSHCASSSAQSHSERPGPTPCPIDPPLRLAPPPCLPDRRRRRRLLTFPLRPPFTAPDSSLLRTLIFTRLVVLEDPAVLGLVTHCPRIRTLLLTRWGALSGVPTMYVGRFGKSL
ncbi:hypothetical protein BDK51DRAFT_45517 [Blyttiomyces helicus]|uniref:F-box domain-containing protein n=1 Tax=Blyttiomyces helicus TaxID=388810 RepID=A0A4P9WKX2_9FUNG|nr:hypothetical protein BDK51DRAFT_45517 [Blyttiomyces helicus]|eukprot:RKO91266.1 hypothetical protein BDK51DRAFT_45517 [Blyttiomyces helicus]